MALPKIDLPTYKLHLDSIGKEVTFRPFVVKEEKILMIALESNDYDAAIDSIKQIIRNCVLDDIDVDALPMFELEHLFLHLRSRSMGELAVIKYICENVIEQSDPPKKCKGQMELNVDLLKTSVDQKKKIDNNIKITDKVGIKLKYPTVEISKILSQDINIDEVRTKILKECAEYIYDEEQVYKIEDMAEGEFETFIETQLNSEMYNKIQNFFYNMPQLVYETDLVCKKCGTSHKIRLEGLMDFFE
jgi:hypothetical protein